MKPWKLVPFKNVECLIVHRYRAISQTTLLSLPRLREVHFKEKIESVVANETRRGLGTVDRVKRKLSEFLDEAEKLRGCDFQFTFSGFQLTKAMLD